LIDYTDFIFVVSETDILPRTRKIAKRHTNIDINIDLGCFYPSGTFDFCHKTYNYTYSQKEISFYRGYTGHEHLLGMGYFIPVDPNEIMPPLEIINMNGRIYDPILGQFLQPDNNVATPENYIGYDRYAYCLNNPLNMTDHSGENPLIVAAIIGGLFNVISNIDNINNPWDAVKFFGIGAVAGLAGGAAGMGVASITNFGGFAAGALIGATGGGAGGFITGAGNAWANGSKFGDGLLAGLESGGMGALTGGLIGGLSGAMSAYEKGYDILDGSKISESVSSTSEGFPCEWSKQNYDTDEALFEKRAAKEVSVKEKSRIVKDFYANPAKHSANGLPDYKMLTSGKFLNPANGEVVNAFTVSYVDGTNYVCASHYVITSDNVEFVAQTGHELQHCFQNNAIISKIYLEHQGERAAYRWQYNYYQSQGRYQQALELINTASSIYKEGYSCWGDFMPKYYTNFIP
jgi:RHS repeat-associated protein